MKLLYLIHSTYNPGGMERVLLNKVKYLVEKKAWDVMVVTTDQKGRPSFYPFPESVKMIDLGINYSDDNGKPFLKKFVGYLKRRKKHKKRLAELLKRERPDVLDCFYPGECSFVPALKDGSKKVMELHQSKLFHFQYNRSGLMGLADKVRARMDEKLVRKFDSFVVLTQEDRQMWGEMPGIVVIPNAAYLIAERYSDLCSKQVVAVGRMDYQKGYDRLIKAWEIVCHNPMFEDWNLAIYGQGEWKEMLEEMITERNLNSRISLNPPTNDIGKVYSESSMLVMSSNYEGFPMVMIEAMASGLPVVSFDFKCGPKDIIDNGENGFLVSNGDIDSLAETMMKLMADDELRKEMGEQAKKVVERYSEQKVMDKWVSLFENLVKIESK